MSCPAAAGREDEDRQGGTLVAQLTDQIEAAHAGQAQVDDGEIMVEFAGAVERFFRIGHGIDDMTGFTQTHLEVVAQQVFVFDDEDLHADS